MKVSTNLKKILSNHTTVTFLSNRPAIHQFCLTVNKLFESIRIKYFRFPSLLISMSDAHFSCIFMNTDSPVVTDTNISLLLNPNTRPAAFL
jgi:hypothetical protein